MPTVVCGASGDASSLPLLFSSLSPSFAGLSLPSFLSFPSLTSLLRAPPSSSSLIRGRVVSYQCRICSEVLTADRSLHSRGAFNHSHTGVHTPTSPFSRSLFPVSCHRQTLKSTIRAHQTLASGAGSPGLHGVVLYSFTGDDVRDVWTTVVGDSHLDTIQHLPSLVDGE